MAQEKLSPCGREVRRFDNDRFMTVLFAPAAAREALFALYAFNLEIAQIRERVKEPLLGEMRLTWWSEAIGAIYAGRSVPPQPVTVALAAAIHRHGLSRASFDRLLTARHADMDDAAPADLAALIEYAAATAGSLALLSLEILGTAGSSAAAQAAEQVAIAWALVGLMRAVPFHARSHRIYLPADLNRQAGLDVWAMFERGPSPGLSQVVERVAGEAEGRLRAARSLRREVPRPALPALLSATLADAYLARLARCGYDPYASAVQWRPPMGLVRMALNAATGRY